MINPPSQEIIGNAIITHQNFEKVLEFKLGSINVGKFIHDQSYYILFSFKHYRPDQCEIYLPDNYSEIPEKTFDVIDSLYSQEKGCLAASLSSFIFESMTPFWRCLLSDGKHILAIQFWRKVISITNDWEKKTRKHIHKGSPYAFVAHTYLMIGDIDTGFSFIYNAIKDDIELNKVCHKLNYPKKAPVYRTATISSSRGNIMFPLVAEIRSKLLEYINSYNQQFGRKFKMEELDAFFLQNDNLTPLNYFFVFTIWSIFEYQRKVDEVLMDNEFSKFKNYNWLLGLCLVIDKLLYTIPEYRNDTLSQEVKKIVTGKAWMENQADLDGFKNQLARPLPFGRAQPDDIIHELLEPSLQYNGQNVKNEIKYLLIALNLRNFASHNILPQEVIVKKFSKILEILILDILLVLEEYKWYYAAAGLSLLF